jgi:hypothetical protein
MSGSYISAEHSISVAIDRRWSRGGIPATRQADCDDFATAWCQRGVKTGQWDENGRSRRQNAWAFVVNCGESENRQMKVLVLVASHSPLLLSRPGGSICNSQRARQRPDIA